MSCIPAWARSPKRASSGRTIMPATSPRVASWDFVIWETVWRAVTWPISCPTNDAERPGQARPLAARGQRLAQPRHVRLQRVVRVEAERGGDFLVRLLSHRD